MHLLQQTDVAEFDSVLHRVDLVIHQNIGPAFKYFSTAQFKERFPSKLFVSFPSLFFLGYWPSMMYLRKPTGGTLPGVLGDYHDERIVRGYIDGLSCSDVFKQMISKFVQNDVIDLEFAKLRSREKSLDICGWDLVQRFFRERRLFYVMNHPVNWLMLEITIRIANFLNFVVDLSSVDSLRSRHEFFDSMIAPVDFAVIKSFNIKFLDYDFYFSKESGGKISILSFIEKNYKIYDGVNNMLELLAFAKERQKFIEGR